MSTLASLAVKSEDEVEDISSSHVKVELEADTEYSDYQPESSGGQSVLNTGIGTTFVRKTELAQFGEQVYTV